MDAPKKDDFLLDTRGERVREERKRLGLTQLQVAEQCEVHRNQWVRYEKNEQKLDGEVLKRFIALGADGDLYRDWETDRKSTRLNSSHITRSRMPSSA